MRRRVIAQGQVDPACLDHLDQVGGEPLDDPDLDAVLDAADLCGGDIPVYCCGPEALLQAFITLQKKIDAQPLTGEGRPRHLDASAPGEFPVPEQGEHDLEPPANKNVWTVPTIIQ